MLRRSTLLLFLGFTSEAVYLATVLQLPWWRYGGTLRSWAHLLGQGAEGFGICLAGIGVLMVAYLWGWRIIRQGEGNRWIVWGCAVLFAVTLFWLLPITSDLFTYLSQAHLLTDLGGNPLLDAPLDFADPLVTAYPALYAKHPSVYGPGWLLLSAPGTLGPHDVATGIFYLKGLATAAYLGCAWLLERILRHLRPTKAVEGLHLFAWNPLILLMAVGDGHNDIVMMVLVLLAVWIAYHERWVLALGAVTLSVWVKYVSVIFFPLLVFHAWRRLGGEQTRRRWTLFVEGAVVGLTISAMVFVPFWHLEEMVGITKRFLQPINWQGGTTPLTSWILGTGLVLFAAAYTLLAWRVLRGDGSYQQWLNAGFVAALLAFLLGASRSQPWHLIWPTALAGLSDRKWAWPVVAALSALMLVVQVWTEWGAPGI